MASRIRLGQPAGEPIGPGERIDVFFEIDRVQEGADLVQAPRCGTSHTFMITPVKWLDKLPSPPIQYLKVTAVRKVRILMMSPRRVLPLIIDDTEMHLRLPVLKVL